LTPPTPDTVRGERRKRNRSHPQTHNTNNTTHDTTRTTHEQHNTRHDKNNTTKGLTLATVRVGRKNEHGNDFVFTVPLRKIP